MPPIVLILLAVVSVIASGVAAVLLRWALRLDRQGRQMRAELVMYDDHARNGGRALLCFDALGRLVSHSGAPMPLSVVISHRDEFLAALEDSGRAVRAMLDRASLRGLGDEMLAWRADGSGALHVRATPLAADAAPHPIVLTVRLPTRQEHAALMAPAQIWPHRLAERRLLAAVDALTMPMWLRSPGLRLVWVNAAYARAVEADVETVIRRQIELASTPSLGSGRRLAERARQQGHAYAEAVHLVIGGGRRRVRVIEEPLAAEPEIGLAAFYLGYAVDITGEEDLGRELDRHVRAQHEVLEQLGSAIAVFGPDKRLSFHNGNFVRLWGLDERWLNTGPGLGEVLDELRARGRLPETSDFRAYRQQALDQFTALPNPREEILHLPDGTTLRALVTPHPMGGLLFNYEDVTRPLALETSLNTLMAVQRETLDNLAEGVAVWGGDGRLRLCNPTFRALFGLQEAPTEGDPHVSAITARMLVHLAPLDRQRDLLLSLALGREPSRQRLDLLDGRVIDVASVPLPDGAVLNTFLDITDTVRMEQSLRADNATLAETDRLKSEVLASIAQQLRGPALAVRGHAGILASEQLGLLAPGQLAQVAGIQDAAERLGERIEDILDLGSIEAGLMVLDRGLVDVAVLLGDVAQLVGDWARRQAITLTVECSADVGLILADERRLKRALFRLVGSALRATPAGGLVSLSAMRRGDSVAVCIVDTGAGPVMRGLHRLLDINVPLSTDGAAQDAGVGLVLVRRLIDLHEGRLEVEAEPGGGTRICCLLPAPSLKPPSLAPVISDDLTND
jgi:signal transduction histidine kinase